MKTALLTLAAIGVTEGRMGFGSCPKMSYQPNFDMNRLMGQWYEQRRDKLFTFEF